jgi:HEAT repeat protein
MPWTNLGITLAVVTSLCLWQRGGQHIRDDVPPAAPSEVGSRPIVPPAPWLQGDPADSLRRIGIASLQRGDYRRAAEAFAAIGSRFPKSGYAAEALYWRAFALYRVGSTRELRQALESLRAQEKQFPDAYIAGDAQALRQRILGELASRGDTAAGRAVTAEAQRIAAEQSAGVDTACGDPDNDVKIAALNALAQMDSNRARTTLAHVLQRRDRGSVCLRRTAVLVLGQQLPAGAEGMLLDAARNDPDLEVRRQAVLWLSQFNTQQSVVALDSVIRGGSPEVTEYAVLTLSQLDTPEAQASLRVYAARSDLPAETRAQVIGWLLERPSEENAAFLRQLYGRLKDADLRRAIVESMAQTVNPANASWLVGVVEDTTQSVELRSRALEAAVECGAPVDALAPLYSPKLDRQLRTQLIGVYTQHEEPVVLDRIAEAAKHDPDPQLRNTALAYLTASRNPAAAKALQEIVEEK